MATFNIGDRVEVIKEYERYEYPDKLLGKQGIVREISNTLIGVEFDHDFTGSHYLSGNINERRGWRFHEEHLKKIEVKRRGRKPSKLVISTSDLKIKTDGYQYGMEIEAITPYNDDDEIRELLEDNGLQCETDGSIEYNDNESEIEVKTSKPESYDNILAYAKDIENVADNYGMRVNTSCGFHVHMSHPKFMQKRYLTRILATWASIEDFLYSTQPESRRNNSYCKKQLESVMQGYFNKLPNSRSQLISVVGNMDRYRSLNLNALRAHGTLECRLHAGTLSAQKIQSWIYLLTAFYNYCLNDYRKDEVEMLFNMQFTRKKVNYIYTMLGISRPVRTYFNRRINRMNNRDLQVERFTAIKTYKLIKKIGETENKIQKEQIKRSKLEDALYQQRDKAQSEFQQLNLSF